MASSTGSLPSARDFGAQHSQLELAWSSLLCEPPANGRSLLIRMSSFLEVPQETVLFWKSAPPRDTIDSWARALRAFSDFLGPKGFSFPTDSKLSAFAVYLRMKRILAYSTVNRYVGDLIRIWSLVGGDPPSSVGTASLMRSGLSRLAPVPKVVLRTLTASRLVQTWRELPSGSLMQRRNRCLLLLAVLLAARPVNVLSLSRDKLSIVSVSDDMVSLRFVGDKGSLLRGSTASRIITVPRDPVIDLGHVLNEYILETAQFDIVPLPRLRGSRPLFFCLDKKRVGLPLKVETISRLMTGFLRKAGAEPDVSARHLRSIVASSAFELGASVQAICLHCRWESSTVFFNFYLRSCLENRLEQLPSSGGDGSTVPRVLIAAFHRDFGHSQ